MTEENGKELTGFDAEWEIRKMGSRIMDLMDLIDELRAKDKSLSARISRMKLAFIEEEGEEVPEEREDPRVQALEDMSIEDRAILFAKLMDQTETER